MFWGADDFIMMKLKVLTHFTNFLIQNGFHVRHLNYNRQLERFKTFKSLKKIMKTMGATQTAAALIEEIAMQDHSDTWSENS